MKKLLTACLFLMSMSTYAVFGNLYLKVATDVSSDYSSDVEESSKLGFGLEYTLDLPLTGLELGAGAMYYNDGEAIAVESFEEKNDESWNYDIYEAETYGSLPFYVTAKYNFTSFPIKPYLKANLGYSYTLGTKAVTVKDTGKIASGTSPAEVVADKVDIGSDIYYGIGIGAQFPLVNVEILYQVATYDKVTLLLGVKF